MLLIGNGRLITQNAENPYLEDGCVVVEDTKIKDFGTTADMKAKYPEADFEDVQGKIIMPGLINMHTHIYSSFARGLTMDQPEPNHNFMEILENQWWRIDKALTVQDSKYSAYATLLESVRYGVTTVFDHHASPYHIEGSLFGIADAAKDIGVRTSLCYEVSDRDGVEIADRGIKENMDFIRYANKENNDLIKGMMGMHASFTISDQTMEKILSAMESEKAGYHIHVSEDQADVYDSLSKYGKRVINRLSDWGILTDKTLTVHCVHVSPEELRLIKDNNCVVIHNCESNMGNAVGCSNVMQMMAQGITVGMGTDAYTQDMFESLRVANIIHKHNLCNPSIGFGETLQMLFQNNREIVSRFFAGKMGIIEPDAYADLAIVDYTPHTPMHADNLGGHLMFGIMGRSVDSTMINGRFVMKNREMLTVDEAQILASARKQAADFWNRV